MAQKIIGVWSMNGKPSNSPNKITDILLLFEHDAKLGDGGEICMDSSGERRTKGIISSKGHRGRAAKSTPKPQASPLNVLSSLLEIIAFILPSIGLFSQVVLFDQQNSCIRFKSANNSNVST